MKHFLYLAAIGIIAFFSACSHAGSKQQETISNERENALKTLGDSLHAITEKYPGEIGDDNGVLSAYNDVGFIDLPDGRHYTLAVLVKDFKGNETVAAKSIADISATVYSILTDKIYRSNSAYFQ